MNPKTPRFASSKVIVVANHKGGSGKTTLVVNLAVALMRAGMSVAAVDADASQESLTHYMQNRDVWARRRGTALPVPMHETLGYAHPEETTAHALRRIDELAAGFDVVVIDTAGHDDPLNRSIHERADVLVTPLNDSFVDLDVLAAFDPETLAIAKIGKYGKMVQDLREARRAADRPDLEWIVVRNRLSALNTHNKKHIARALSDLSQVLGFRCAEGLAERLIFREFFPRGLTAADDLSQAALGVRPTMSHATAQLEIQSLVRDILLVEVEADTGPEELHVNAA
jgi:chromosome partitioning protein